MSTLDGLQKAKKNLATESTSPNILKPFCQFIWKNSRTKCMYLAYKNTGIYMPIIIRIYTDDVSVDQASPNPDGKR